MMDPEIIEFLEESNGIEGVYGAEPLRQAIIAWEYLFEQEKLTTGVVRKTHKILMIGQPGLLPDERGYFRHVDVFVGMHKGVPPHLIDIFISSWVERMNAPEHDWKTLHVEYEKIHPFVDGNGRSGRMFMNWGRLKRCKLPALTIFEAEKGDYYSWFK